MRPGRIGLSTLGAQGGTTAQSLRSTLDELERILVRQSLEYGDFTLASGVKSHYYCDAKRTLLSPRGARLCGEALWRVLASCDVEAVGGLAMGAAYVAAAVVQASSSGPSPLYGYTVRRERKDHGRGQKIDESWHPDNQSLIRPGRRVAVVDDVVTTAGSTCEAIAAVQAADCDVRVVATILDRNAGGAARIREMGLPFYSLFVADDNGHLRRGDLPAELL